jgi:protein involved in polysaccharide export with SLBB domain
MDRLKLFVRAPQVEVSVIETARPQVVANPVYLVGAFKQPGVYSLGTRPETLSEVLMRTGGLLPTAMRRVRVIRRAEQGKLDLKNVTESTDGKTTYGEVALTVTGELVDPADNIVLKPQDVIVAMKLEPVFVAGEVARSGAFPLEDRDYLSATQILAMAGAGPAADLERVRVLRVVGDTSQRAEITINLKDIFSGKANDFPLMANDVLYIPRKSSATRTLTQIGLIAVPAMVTSLIWVWVRR